MNNPFMLRGVAFLCASIVSLSAFEISANAQTRKKRSPGGMLSFALRAEVQKDIGIQNDEVAIAKLEELRESALKKQEELLAATKGDKDQYVEESFRNIDVEYRDDLKKLLSAMQYKQVQQVWLRVLNYRVLTDPEIAEALNLQPDQVKELSAAQRDNIKRQKEYTSTVENVLPHPARDEISRRLGEINLAYHNRVEEILSAKQQAKFAEMKGTPTP